MRVTVGELKRLIREETEADDLNTLEVGDMVDVDVDEIGTLPVRVVELVDDVNVVAGPRGDPNGPGAEFYGPGFVGEIDPASGESGTLVFSMNQVMPGSKMKSYFPKLGDEFDEDEYGRPMNNPYRDAGRRFAVKARSRSGDYLPDGFDESATKTKSLGEARRSKRNVSKTMHINQIKTVNPKSVRGLR